MNKEKTAVFVGHSQIFCNIRDMLKYEIIRLIREKGVDTFLNGGMGEFDMLSAKCIEVINLYDDIYRNNVSKTIDNLSDKGYNIGK